MTTRTLPLGLATLLLAAPSFAGPAKPPTPQQAAHRLTTQVQAFRGKARAQGLGLPAAYHLMGLSRLEDGERVSQAKDLVVRGKGTTTRVMIKKDQATVIRRIGDLRTRLTMRLVGGGLALTSRTDQVGKRTERQHFVELRNAGANVGRELSADELSTLRRTLSSPLLRLGSWMKARWRGDPRATAAFQLERALNKMGIKNSVDWR